LTTIYDDINDIDDVPELLIKQIEHFFENYKDLDNGKGVKVDKWEGREAARQAIEKAAAAVQGKSVRRLACDFLQQAKSRTVCSAFFVHTYLHRPLASPGPASCAGHEWPYWRGRYRTPWSGCDWPELQSRCH